MKPQTGGQCAYCRHVMHAEIVPNTGGNLHFARCPKCSSQGPWQKSAAEALAACEPEPPPEFTLEEARIVEVIMAARTVQSFLWGPADGTWDFAKWLQIIHKRIEKLDGLDRGHTSAAVEVRKRLLQLAALSVALMGILETDPEFVKPAF